MTNPEIAAALEELADRLVLGGEPALRVNVYRRAAELFRAELRSISLLSAQGELTEFDGIGPAIAEKVEMLVTTGSFPALDRARIEISDTLVSLIQLPGIGAKTAHTIVGIVGDNLPFNELARRAHVGDLTAQKGLSEKTIATLAAAWERREAVDSAPEGVTADMHAQYPNVVWTRRDIAAQLADELRRLLPNLNATMVGTYARGWEVVADVELVISSTDPATEAVNHALALEAAGWECVREAQLARAWRAPNGVIVVLEYCTEPGLATRIDERCSPLGWQPHGNNVLVPFELRERVQAGAMAADEAATAELVNPSTLRGELHGHTDWSDGSDDMLTMARAARDQGDAYYLVSDHSAPYALVNGLDAERIGKQATAIAQANEQLTREHEIDGAPPFTLLHGSEVEILADGSLGLDDAVLETLDWVVASIHTAQTQSPDAIAQRMQRVLANPFVDAIGHPTSRLVLRRPATALDTSALIEWAAASGVVLELNAHPRRLDLDAARCAEAKAAGVKIAINCDAHATSYLAYRKHGVAVARRAGLAPSDVVNCASNDAREALRPRHRS
jgi:DNA polymerase (family 10)